MRTMRRGRTAGTTASFVLTRSPLKYNHDGDVKRLQIVDPAAPPPDARATYFVPVEFTTKYAKNGKLLAKPRVTERVPGADPGVIAWLDFHLRGRGGDTVYIDYTRVREDMKKRGLAKRLVDELVHIHGPNVEYDFGRIEHEGMGKIADALERRGLRVHGKHLYRY